MYGTQFKKILAKIPRRVIEVGGSTAITFPTPVAELMDLKKDMELILTVEEGKHGKFMALWPQEKKTKK